MNYREAQEQDGFLRMVNPEEEDTQTQTSQKFEDQKSVDHYSYGIK